MTTLVLLGVKINTSKKHNMAALSLKTMHVTKKSKFPKYYFLSDSVYQQTKKNSWLEKDLLAYFFV